MEDWMKDIYTKARRIRLRALDLTLRNNSGYLSQVCSAAEILCLLYGKILKLSPSIAQMIPPPFSGTPGLINPDYISGAVWNGARGPDFDRFIFSPAHYATALYLALIEVGRMAPEALDLFNKDGNCLELIGAEHSPGFETTTGSLGQALSHAGGIALGRRLKGETGRTWVFLSDGEFQEGQTWEAIQALVWYKLDSVCVFVDVNQQQCDGPMDKVMAIGPLADKLKAFGAYAFSVDGHDVEAMYELSQSEHSGQPLFLLCLTNPTEGIPILDSERPKLHYLRFSCPEHKKKYKNYFEDMKKVKV